MHKKLSRRVPTAREPFFQDSSYARLSKGIRGSCSLKGNPIYAPNQLRSRAKALYGRERARFVAIGKAA
jgi:hypothetical protein